MLPDFVAIKKQLGRQVLRELESAIYKHAPIAREIKTHRMHEGDRFSYETVDKEIVTDQFEARHQRFELPANLPPDEMERRVKEKFGEMAEAIGSSLEKSLFKKLDDITQKTGNVINAEGKPFHPSMIWDVVEKMPIDFDKRGQPELPTWVIHPDLLRFIKENSGEWDRDVHLAKRRAQVVEQKREEWRDREATRKLARQCE